MQRLSNTGATAKFADSGQSGQYNHGHASQMGHAAALRLQAARALSGRPTAPAPMTPGGPTGTPGGAPTSFKQNLAAGAAQQGKMVGLPHIHAAIDSLAGKGHLSQFQAAALKAHNGHLVGPQGAATQTAIMNEMLK